MKELDPDTVESSELVEQTFNFWFKGPDHIRSPFPEYMHRELKDKSVERFYKWARGLDHGAQKEINETILGEKFEEIIFEIAMDLALTEDEKVTINYPFMPRIGDEINAHEEERNNERSLVVDRSIEKSGDQLFMKVYLERVISKERWETKFELPA